MDINGTQPLEGRIVTNGYPQPTPRKPLPPGAKALMLSMGILGFYAFPLGLMCMILIDLLIVAVIRMNSQGPRT